MTTNIRIRMANREEEEFTDNGNICIYAYITY